MKKNHFKLFSVLLLITSITFINPTFAQTPSNTDAANCEELKDSEVGLELDLCTAHAGCVLAMGIQKACVKTKKFLTNLKTIMTRDDAQAKEAQAADTSIFGKLKMFIGGLGKKEVNANQVFEASMSDEMRTSQATDKDWWDKAALIRAGVAKADQAVLTGQIADGSKWTFIGDVKDGKANGWGAQYWSSGHIMRGEFKDNNLHGMGDSQTPANFRTMGSFVNGSPNGENIRMESTGRVIKGNYVNGKLDGYGSMYGADGVLLSKGIWSEGSLYVGETYDALGVVLKKIDKPGDERQAREAAEQTFQDSLNAMTASQLYAKAGELSSSDKDKSDQMLQALMSRFPDHPLAKQTSEKIAQERVVAGEIARRQAESQRRQDLLARQQAEETQRLAAQQAERNRMAAEQAKREHDALVTQRLQEAAKLMEALTGVIQQRRQGGGDASTSAASSFGNVGSGGMDTSSSCRGRGSCQFQMPTLSGCGTYASVSYPGHYGMEQTNTCSYDVYYKLVIKKGPNFDSYGGHDEFPRLKPGQKFRGNGMFFKSETTKVLEDYSCKTREDVSRMLGMKVAGGPDPNRKGCTYITPPDEVGTSQ